MATKPWTFKNEPEETLTLLHRALKEEVVGLELLDTIALEEMNDKVERANIRLRSMGWEVQMIWSQEDKEITLIVKPIPLI